jgi:ATP-dependent Clp protease ATP-binding subunit ClpA
MIAQELEVSLHMAFVEARQQRHEFITVEHLLLALLDNPSAAEVLRACSANIDDLRKSLTNFIKDNTPQVAGTDEVDTQPTLGFQRVIQRAIMHVQSTGNGKKEVTGANVLVAIFGEKDSHAVYYLHQQGVTRLDVVNFIAHGIKKSDPPSPPRPRTRPRARRAAGRAQRKGLAAGAVHPEPEPARQGRQDRPADRPRLRGRARDPDPVPPPQEQPAAGGRGRRGQDGHCRRPGLAHHAEGRARGAGRRHGLFARHGRAAGRHQVPRRLRAAPQGRAQALKDKPNAILFIDEIHTLIGAGAASGGTLDASNLLKPALSSGQLKCIGATTFTEYRGIFEKDAALSRRFQKVDVVEPTVPETVEILKGLKSRFEEHHSVKYAPPPCRPRPS